MNILWLLLVAIGINVAIFLLAYIRRTDKLTDFAYGLTFVILGVAAYSQSTRYNGQLALLILILLWVARLTSYLVLRVLQKGKDQRFDGIREHFWRFGSFWLAQGVSVWVILLPAIFAWDSKAFSFDGLSMIGLVIWVAGFSIEAIADGQKYRFMRNPKNKGTWIESGLWAHSRHPNYFGEITVWIGVYVIALPSLSASLKLVALVSPLWIAILLIKISGIPKLEAHADEKWGGNPHYQAYKKRVGLLIPKP